MIETPRLVAEDLRKTFGAVRAVEGVSFVVHPGEVVGLVGPNGSGKSTLVDLITGAQRSEDGSVRIDGTRVAGAPSRRARRWGLFRTFQHPQLATDLTIRENLLLGAFLSSMGSVPRMLYASMTGAVGLDKVRDLHGRAVDEMAASLGLDDLDRTADELTLGEMRLVEVGRALLHTPRVLLLDEPFAGSDADGAHRLLTVVEQVKAMNCAIVLIDHNVDLVARACSRLVLLSLGQVAFDGPTHECLRSAEMRTIYVGDVV